MLRMGVHHSLNENFGSRKMKTITGITKETGLYGVDGSGGSVSEVSRETTRTTLGMMAHSSTTLAGTKVIK